MSHLKIKLDVDVFQGNFLLISSNLFEFVKCYKRTISASTGSNNFKWDFGHTKSLAGEEKLYMMRGLLYQSHVVIEHFSDEESSPETSTLGSATTSSYGIPA